MITTSRLAARAPKRIAVRLLMSVLALSLFATACGSDSEIVIPDVAAPSAAVAEEPVAEESAMTDRPERIVSLSPSATEMLYAIGAGEQVIAVDAFSNYPEGTPVTDLSGWDPNVEAVLSYEPDLVFTTNSDA